MIKELFGSDTKVKLLRQFVLEEIEPTHLRALSRLIDEEVNSVRHTLKVLISIGIIKEKRHFNKKLYFVNRESPIFTELKLILLKDRADIASIRSGLEGVDGIETVILTDNYFKSIPDKDSVDILVVGSPIVDDLEKSMHTVEKKLDRKFRIALLSRADFLYKKRQRDIFILNLLSKDKYIILGSDKILWE